MLRPPGPSAPGGRPSAQPFTRRRASASRLSTPKRKAQERELAPVAFVSNSEEMDTVSVRGARPLLSRSASARWATSLSRERSQLSTCSRERSWVWGSKRFPLESDRLSARSFTSSPSSPFARACSQAPVRSPNSRRSREPPYSASSPAVAIPRAFTRSPSLPPRPRRRSTGSSRSSAGTALGKSAVCWLGLCRPEPSFARSLFPEIPAEQLYPSSWRTWALSLAASAQPAARSSSPPSRAAPPLPPPQNLRGLPTPPSRRRKLARAAAGAAPVGAAPRRTEALPGSAPSPPLSAPDAPSRSSRLGSSLSDSSPPPAPPPPTPASAPGSQPATWVPAAPRRTPSGPCSARRPRAASVRSM